MANDKDNEFQETDADSAYFDNTNTVAETVDESNSLEEETTTSRKKGDKVKKGEPGEKKKSSGNLIIVGAVVIAAVGYFGYKYLTAPEPMPAPRPVAMGAQNQNALPNPSQLNAPPMQENNVAPPVPQANQLPTPPVQQPQSALPQLPGVVNNGMPAPIPSQNSAMPSPSHNVNGAGVPSLPSFPNNTVTVTEEVETENVAGVSQAEFEELQDKLTVLEDKIINVDEKIIKAMAEQAEYRLKFDNFVRIFGEKLDGKFAEYDKTIQEMVERIEYLETKHPKRRVAKDNASTADKKVDAKPATTTATKPTPKPAPKPAPKPVAKSAPVDADVLIDRGGEVKVKLPEPKPVVAKPAPKPVAVAAPAPKQANINIHALVNGRFWIKNGDGTIQSFTEGDRLPTGEVVQNIFKRNSENVVVTDKRTIVN